MARFGARWTCACHPLRFAVTFVKTATVAEASAFFLQREDSAAVCFLCLVSKCAKMWVLAFSVCKKRAAVFSELKKYPQKSAVSHLRKCTFEVRNCTYEILGQTEKYQKSKPICAHLIQENTNIRKLTHADQCKQVSQVRVKKYTVVSHLLVFILHSHRIYLSCIQLWFCPLFMNTPHPTLCTQIGRMEIFSISNCFAPSCCGTKCWSSRICGSFLDRNKSKNCTSRMCIEAFLSIVNGNTERFAGSTWNYTCVLMSLQEETQGQRYCSFPEIGRQLICLLARALSALDLNFRNQNGPWTQHRNRKGSTCALNRFLVTELRSKKCASTR